MIDWRSVSPGPKARVFRTLALAVGGGLCAPPESAWRWYEHWNTVLVLTVGLPEVDEKIALFESSDYDDPRSPKHVEEELIG